MIRVALVEDHIMVRQAIKRCLEDTKELMVVCEAECGAEFEKKYKPDEIDVVLLDLQLNGQHGLITCQNLCQKFPDIKIIILTEYSDAGLIVHMIKNGARAYVKKREDLDRLVTAIHHVIKNGYYFDQDLGRILNIAMDKKYKSRIIDDSFRVEFSEGEMQVALHACCQLTIDETVEKMRSTKRIVENHRNRLLEKTDSKNIMGVMIYMFTHLILFPEQFSENDYFRK